MIPTLLVANRGEIACRVIRSARALGFRTVAVYSDADAEAPHVSLADRAVRIGPAAVGESYLSVPALLLAATRTRATHVHPGYGFLSEDAGFASAVIDAGLVWVGPPPAAIAAMGDKARAKARMRAAGVPVVPGAEGDADALRAAAEEVGYPLLVKASGGGGGRGIRRVDGPDQLAPALERAAAEALAAFGSDRLLLEKLVEGARHVEVQILADAHGHVVHLGERDCSTQRRHQKVIEEAPCPVVGPDLRAAMGEAACAAARAVDYVGAGTVELLLGEDQRFYFLEMNTRLQVEHPVTELITGLDLVELQLRVALGEPLSLDQDGVRLDGHAIEARLYAEDPAEGFVPRTGMLHAFSTPVDRAGVRIDAGVRAGAVVGSDYDPMIAKIIAWGPDRETARRRLALALEDTVVLGVTTNRAFLGRVLTDGTFRDGDVRTDTLASRTDLTERPARDPETIAIAAAVLAEAGGVGALSRGFRNAHPLAQPLVLDVDDDVVSTTLVPGEAGIGVRVEDTVFSVVLGPVEGPSGRRTVTVDGVTRVVHAVQDGRDLWLAHGSDAVRVRRHAPAGSAAEDRSAPRLVRAPSAGKVLAVPIAVGDAVQSGDVVCVIEAMKIETRLRAAADGVVAAVRVGPGDVTAAGDVVVELTLAPQESP